MQPYFETPMLNFNHYSASADVREVLSAHVGGTSRGMWHQYGKIEKDPTKGIFLQATDIPDVYNRDYYRLNLDSRPAHVSNAISGSLAKLCGFRNEPVKLGKIASVKVISEAVVAIPFVEEDGQRKFFKLDPLT